MCSSPAPLPDSGPVLGGEVPGMTPSYCQSGEEKGYRAEEGNSSTVSSQLNSKGTKSENFSSKQKKTQTSVQIEIVAL